MLLEYRAEGPPATELGAADARWWTERKRAIDRAG
jgi:hypothetical protein